MRGLIVGVSGQVPLALPRVDSNAAALIGDATGEEWSLNDFTSAVVPGRPALVGTRRFGCWGRVVGGVASTGEVTDDGVTSFLGSEKGTAMTPELPAP